VDSTVLVCRDDIGSVAVGDQLRLKDLYNIEVTSVDPLNARCIDNSLKDESGKRRRIIHWAPVENVPVKVLGPLGETTGVAESGVVEELDRMVQFERFGFCRIDSVDEGVVAYFAHK
jgi:glutamyl-tRNA synthetase